MTGNLTSLDNGHCKEMQNGEETKQKENKIYFSSIHKTINP